MDLLGCSSIARTLGLQPGGCGLKSHRLHQFMEGKPGVAWARS